MLLAVPMTAATCWGEEQGPIRANWQVPHKCDPFAPVRIADLKEELRQTGYRLAIAIHPAQPAGATAEPPPRDLYLVNADGSGLKQLTDTPDQEETMPRTAPDGTKFTYDRLRQRTIELQKNIPEYIKEIIEKNV